MKDDPQVLSAVELKRAQIPKHMVCWYDRAMAGNSRRAAMIAFCLECVGWERREVRECTATACPLYLYRPYRQGEEEPELEIGVDLEEDPTEGELPPL